MTDDEIISEVVGKRAIDDSFSSDDDEESDSQSSVSDTKACKTFDIALKWLESQCDTNPVHLLLVKKWRYCSYEPSEEPRTEYNNILLYKNSEKCLHNIISCSYTQVTLISPTDMCRILLELCL